MAGSYDLAIVGAGFAGLSAAHAAATRGVKTIVLDRKLEVGARPHTTGLLVKEVADEWDVPRNLTRKIQGVRLYSPSLNHVDLHRPGYHFLATDTPALLRWWAQQARRAGAWVRCDSPYRGASQNADGVGLNEYDIHARYLIGADGARSRVAADFQLGRNRRHLVGVEAEFEGVGGVDGDHLHVFLDSRLAPGYIGWVIPGVGVTQVGLAVRQGYAARLESFIEKIGRLFDFSRARVVSRRGGLIPVGGTVHPMGRGRVMLVGDAAGMVSPLTAGGIHTALKYGRTAGLAVTDYLFDAGPEPLGVMKACSPRFVWKRTMRGVFDLNVPNGVYDAMIQSPLMRSVAQTVFFHNRGVLSPRVWADVWRQWVRAA